MNWPTSDPNHLIVSSAQMASIEKNLFSRGMLVEGLMEKVGIRLKQWLIKRPDLLENGVQFLIGPGHNGGDGLVLARELYLEGVDVSIWCPFPLTKTLTQAHFRYCNWIGIKELQSLPDVTSTSLWIEALFGLGQSRPLTEEISTLLRSREDNQPRKLISLDVPAGICSDTGKLLSDCAATAAYTLTVGLLKKGLIQDVALPYVGQLIRIDIDIPHLALKLATPIKHYRLAADDLGSVVLPSHPRDSNKYQRGRLLVLAGSEEYLGAASLALQGALSSGVGSIQALLPNLLAQSLWQVAPEIIISGTFEGSVNGDLDIDNFLKKGSLDRMDALLVGPGLGCKTKTNGDFSKALEQFKGLLVLDADALNRLAFSAEGWKWLCKRDGPTWITPHQAEFDRLFPNLKGTSPLEAALQAAKTTGVGVVLKGAHSIIACPSGVTWQLGSSSCSVARAGLGDVLAGFVAGVGAMGVSLKEGVDVELLAISTFLHSEAGRICFEGSKASSIVATLEKLVRGIQDGKCVQKDI